MVSEWFYFTVFVSYMRPVLCFLMFLHVEEGLHDVHIVHTYNTSTLPLNRRKF